MRISSIDFFRTIAIFTVILLHTSPFRDSNNIFFETLYIGLSNATRFAVPFFFIVSGFLFGKQIHSGAMPGKLFKVYVNRLLPLFLIWSMIYMILPTDIKKQVIKFGLWEAIYQKIYNLISHPITLLFEGSRGHLWFLLSLLMALGVITVFLKLNKKQWIIPIASFLYLFGLIAGSYSKCFGIDISFNTRNGPFFSTLFVAVGWCLSYDTHKFRPMTTLGLATIGMTMHMSEVLFLWKYYNISPVNHDYVFGTLLWSTGLTMFVLSIPNAFKENLITKWGRYALGVYLVQLMAIDVLTPLDKIIPFPLWDIMYPLMGYLLSLSMVSFFLKNKWLRNIVAY